VKLSDHPDMAELVKRFKALTPGRKRACLELLKEPREKPKP